MAEKKRKSAKSKSEKVSEELAAEIADRIGDRIKSRGTGATVFSHNDVGVDWSSKFGDGWVMGQVAVVSPGTSTQPSMLDKRKIIAIPILGDVKIGGRSAKIGSATEIEAGAEVSLGNDGDIVAAMILLSNDGTKPHADGGDSDEADDQGVAVIDVGEHGAGGAGETDE